MNHRIAIIAALPEEAEAFCPGQGVAQAGVRHLMIHDLDVHVHLSGIGKVNAAITATHVLLAGPCSLILTIGTAGKIASARGNCFWLTAAFQHDYGAHRATGFTRYSAGTIPVGPARPAPFLAMADPGTGLPRAIIASGDSFVECPETAASIATDLGATLVDMETAAIAQAASRFGVPWAGIRAVSDDANADSAGTFRDNLARAAQLAAQSAEAFLALPKWQNMTL